LLFHCWRQQGNSKETARIQQGFSKEWGKKARKLPLYKPDNSTGSLVAPWSVKAHFDLIQASSKRDPSGIKAGYKRQRSGGEREISEIKKATKKMIFNLRHKPAPLLRYE
jgi:hypothetical protein